MKNMETNFMPFSIFKSALFSISCLFVCCFFWLFFVVVVVVFFLFCFVLLVFAYFSVLFCFLFLFFGTKLSLSHKYHEKHTLVCVS